MTSLEKREPKEDKGYIVFSAKELFGSKSERSRSLLRTLRVLCISHSPDGLPPSDRPSPTTPDYDDYRDPLESIAAVKEIVRKTYESLVYSDGCIPFIAVLEMQRFIRVAHKPFLTKEAICRLAGLSDNIHDVRKMDRKLTYSFENVSDSIVKLTDVSKDLQKELEESIPYLKGFIRSKNEEGVEQNFAVYTDELKKSFGSDDPIFKNMDRGDIDKRIVEKYFSNVRKKMYVDKKEKDGTVAIMELDPISLIHLLKRLLILHYEDPRKPRKIYYSRARKRILKVV